MAEENEIEVKVRADGSAVTPGLNEAKQHVEDFGESFGEVTDKLKEEFLGIFAFEKMKHFTEETITEFAKIERGLNVLGVQVTNNKESWAEYKGVIEDFMTSEDRLYGVTKEQLIGALNNVELKVGDTAVAMKILDDAAKLTAMGIGDLAGNANTLALAYQGNQRGLMGLARLLGISKGAAQDTGLIFDKLAEKLKGVDSITQDTTGHINMMKEGWESFKEYVGGTLAPLLLVFGAIEKVVVNLFQAIFLIGKEIVDLFIIASAITAGNLSLVKEGFREMKEDAQNFGKDVMKVWEDQTKAVQVETDKQFKAQAKKNKALSDAQIKALEDEKKRLAELEAATKAAYERIGKEVERVSEDTTKAFVEARKNGEDGWKAAGEAMLKYSVEALAHEIMAKGQAKLIEAAAASLDPLTAAAAPGMMASGLALEAGGGAIMGLAEVALAEGGIVNRPTVALIGENGPEKVTPLGKGDDGGMHMHGDIVLSFPGVKKASDFSPSEQQNGARKLLNTFDELNRRSGRRAAF